MTLPGFLQPYLASYDLSKLDEDSPQVAREVISQVLNLGDEKAVKWVFDNYTLDQIRQVVRCPSRGIWFRESLDYWMAVLKIDKIIGYRQAVMGVDQSQKDAFQYS